MKILKCGHKCTKICSEVCEALTEIQKKRNFTRSCTKKVNVDLSCGHVTKVYCGALDGFSEDTYKCKKKCSKNLICGHPCKKKCFEDCRTLSEKQSNNNYLIPCEEIIEVEDENGCIQRKPCGICMREKQGGFIYHQGLSF